MGEFNSYFITKLTENNPNGVANGTQIGNWTVVSQQGFRPRMAMLTRFKKIRTRVKYIFLCKGRTAIRRNGGPQETMATAAPARPGKIRAAPIRYG